MVSFSGMPEPPEDAGVDFLRRIRIDPGTVLADLPWVALSPRGAVLARGPVDVGDFGGLLMPLVLVPGSAPDGSPDPGHAPLPARHKTCGDEAEPAPQNVFRLRGDVWQVTYGGKTVYVKDRVGMGYLARILARPDRDIPAAVLFANRTGIEAACIGPGVPLIDAAAHEAYRRRHAELRDEEDRAERAGDAAGLAAAREEMRGLAAELARAVGLGGRVRGRSDADRVRKSVSMAVARDIDRIADSHPELGRHLRRSVSSGFVLRYAPDVPNVWSTEFFPTNPDATDFVALPQEL